MSLPTNSGLAKQRGCNPVSSNCVVWQGPDLDCIGLCKGDTVSEVIAKMAEELCMLIEMFDLGEFDFSCLQVPSSETPADMGGLIQILIDRICALENITPGEPGTGGADCPENCIVPIASCFHFIDGAGNTVTTLPLLDYVNRIGEEICSILDDITVLQNQVDSLNDQINGTGGVVEEIGNLDALKADTSSLQYVNSSKIDPSLASKYITEGLRSVENSLISTQDALGTPTEMYQGIIKAGNISDEQRLAADGLMSSIPGWEITVEDVAASLGNAWLAIRDLREAVEYIQENCCVTNCTDLFLNFTASLLVVPSSTTLTIFTSGSTGFTSEWSECGASGTNIIVRDSAGNVTTFKADLIELIDIPSGFTVDLTPTPIDPTLDITVTAETCFTNDAAGVQCEKDYDYTIYATPVCPPVLLTLYTNSINYQFTSTPGYSYIANVYVAGALTPFTSQVITSPGAVVFNSILGLTADTDYEFELVIVDDATNETPCPKQSFTTLPNNCTPPTGAVAILTI